MRSKGKAEANEIACSICGDKLDLSAYAEHVKTKHAAPPSAGPPPAAIPMQPTYQPPAPTGQTAPTPVTPPPPPAPRNPFINAQMLYANGGRISGTITGVRDATNVRSKTRTDIAQKKGWLIDIQTSAPVKAFAPSAGGIVEVQTQTICGRINEGDSRHQYLWKKFGPTWLNQPITCRIPLPTDNTKAGWVCE